jgi:glucan biosynthesis protein
MLMDLLGGNGPRQVAGLLLAATTIFGCDAQTVRAAEEAAGFSFKTARELARSLAAKDFQPEQNADLPEALKTLTYDYFRVLGAAQRYGSSVRGLAIDTGEPTGAEFPRFTEFWLEKPPALAGGVRGYAPMNSPSCGPGLPVCHRTRRHHNGGGGSEFVLSQESEKSRSRSLGQSFQDRSK